MDVTPFSLDLSSPLATASGPIERRSGYLVRIEADGAVGLGEATPLPGWTESDDECLDALSGDSASGVTPATPAAHHGVELARLDAAARSADVSLAALLADGVAESSDGDRPAPADTVPVNATVGDGSVAETETATREAVEAGYPAVKIKVGARSVDADLNRIRAARAAAGDDVELRADANGAWDLDEARRFLDVAAALDLASVEQPLPAANVSAHGELRGRGVDVALDESLAAVGPDAVLEQDVADVVICKPMVLGGPQRALAVATDAAEHGVSTVVTTTIDAVVARTAALHVAAVLPTPRACGLATGSLLEGDLAPDPAPVERGRLTVPDGAGLAGGAFDSLRFDADSGRR
ncbi:mandelate racemase/muconate lactonizing enzyme family protein [Halobellus clavatus]|uniref:o-succinylbenzoate synthase n=1 Tax=Halobellus clavatus TaxID=660517 RepID=A0A1H3H257_9EURY|nr:o-succinylbenzoate synthase [Halobellus clavatus]SDY09622.1 o-succinylbenzoate synthase [Halobellus clavatus]